MQKENNDFCIHCIRLRFYDKSLEKDKDEREVFLKMLEKLLFIDRKCNSA